MIVKEENKVKLTYTTDTLQSEIIDIDIKGNVDTVTFEKTSGKPYYYPLYISLKDNKKVFPSVTRLIFECSPNIAEIPNGMFPNVTEVVNCNSDIFRNVFYSDEDTVIDLSKYQMIDDYAFSGCKSVNVINTENIQHCALHAFDDSAIDKMPFINGVKMIGTILFDIDVNCPVIEIPKHITCCSEKVKHLECNVMNVTYGDNYDSKIGIKSKKIVIRKGKDEIEDLDSKIKKDIKNVYSWLRETSELEFQDNLSPHFKTIDGIVYDDKGKILIMCPKYKKGNIVIPDGVEMIKQSAFFRCNDIESIVMPDSLIYIEDRAIDSCINLKRISVSQKTTTLGSINGNSIICFCDNLEELILPEGIREIRGKCVFGSFNVKNIDLPEGLKIIGDKAFAGLSKVESISVPDSLISIGRCAFQGAKSIKSTDYKENLIKSIYTRNTTPYCENLKTYADFQEYFFIRFEIKEKIFFIPNYYLTDAGIDKIEDLIISKGLNDNTISQIYEICYDEICNIDLKDCNNYRNVINLILYKISNLEGIKKKMKRTAKKIASEFMKEGYESLFVEFLNLNIISQSSLKALAEYARKNGLVSHQVYLMNHLQSGTNKKQSSFNL